ncbi:hypothetical protein [Macrococcus capreoli]|nr:hypothetical protein [Macrococcus sp. TMW 2.2395]MCU7558223.1 hypothetical protein [Macrococcus sp. TMW 2.2395]
MKFVKKLLIVLSLFIAIPHFIDISNEPIEKSIVADTSKTQSED